MKVVMNKLILKYNDYYRWKIQIEFYLSLSFDPTTQNENKNLKQPTNEQGTQHRENKYDHLIWSKT